MKGRVLYGGRRPRATTIMPSDRSTDALVDRFYAALDREDLPRARRELRRIEDPDQAVPPDELVQFRFALALAEGNDGRAATILAEGLRAHPASVSLLLCAGSHDRQSGALERALERLEECVFLDADHPEAWYELGLVREALGDIEGMKAAFGEVWELDSAPPLPETRFTAAQVEAWADRAFHLLPPPVRDAARRVTVFVQDLPPRWIVEDAPYDPRLVGLFDGPTWEELRTGRVVGQTPHIYVFHRNLERTTLDPRDMAEQVRITIHHEIGHFLGLSEEDLEARGLE